MCPHLPATQTVTTSSRSSCAFVSTLNSSVVSKILSWVDFMSNVVVDVPVSISLGYMGIFFFFLPVSAECMADPLKISEALERGWIFQECTFGRFDEVLVKELSVHLAGWKTIEVKTYLWTILEVSYLLERRGYDKIFERNIPDITNYWGEGGYYGGVAAEPFRLLGGKKAMDLFKELKYSGEEDVSWTVKHVLQHCVGNTPDEVFAFLSSNP